MYVSHCLCLITQHMHSRGDGSLVLELELQDQVGHHLRVEEGALEDPAPAGLQVL